MAAAHWRYVFDNPIWPTYDPATELGFEAIDPKVTHIEQTRPEVFLTFARFEFPIGSFWV